MCQGPEAGDTVPGIIQEASEVETEQVIRVAGESIQEKVSGGSYRSLQEDRFYSESKSHLKFQQKSDTICIMLNGIMSGFINIKL